MSEILRLKPANRHLLVIPHTKDNETPAGVILPEDYSPEQEVYVEATVVDVAEDCGKQFRYLRYGSFEEKRKVIVDRSMLQEVTVGENTHYFVLENYVIALYRGANES